MPCQRSGAVAGAGALATALLGAGVAGDAAMFDGASALLGAFFEDAFDGAAFTGPESILVPPGAVGGRPGSGTPVGAGATAFGGSTAVAGAGAALRGASGAGVGAASSVAAGAG